MEELTNLTDPEFIFNESPIGFISFEPDGRIVKGNGSFFHWFGQSEAELSSVNFYQLLSKGSTLYFQMVLNPILNLRGYSNEIRLTFVSDAGNFDALFNAKAYKDDHGKIVRINAYLLKIIDRKKYEAELMLEKRLAEESLNQANKIIDENNVQFIKIAMNQSHMIRRPLANMLGLISILKDINIPDEAENLIRLLALSAEELDTLINEVVTQTGKP